MKSKLFIAIPKDVLIDGNAVEHCYNAIKESVKATSVVDGMIEIGPEQNWFADAQSI